MRKLALVMVVGCVLGLSIGVALANAAPQAQPAPQKVDKSSVAGSWNMSINAPQGPMAISMTLTQDGKKITGTLSSQMGDTALAGEYADGKLSFSITFEGGGGSMQIAFAATLKDDGTLEGTASSQMGDMAWTAERVK
jgi:hypothetical protein